jgi:hypothetical protein
MKTCAESLTSTRVKLRDLQRRFDSQCRTREDLENIMDEADDIHFRSKFVDEDASPEALAAWAMGNIAARIYDAAAVRAERFEAWLTEGKPTL